MSDYSAEDVGNIIALEHVNVQVPDQADERRKEIDSLVEVVVVGTPPAHLRRANP